ncbi:hypothetical protein ACK344_18710, partial [Aeromonas veronii]
PRNPSRSRKRLLKTALRDNYLEKRRGLVAFKWIAISYVLQSFGELLISPIGYAMIGKLAPASLQGLMMGCWMMVTGVASVLAGYVSGAMPQNIGSTPVATNPGYSSVFNMLGWGSLAGGVVLLLLVPRLRLLIASKITPPPAATAIPV